METMELKAQTRKESGKGPARRLRAGGKIPAIFYGSGTDSLPLAVDTADLLKLLKERKESSFIKLRIQEDGKETERLSIIKELQTSPATRAIFHADFYEIRMDHKLAMDIPIHVTGIPVGVTMGGELHILKRDLRVSGLPIAIPEFVEADISGLEIGNSVKVGDIPVPEGIEVLDSEDIAVVAVSAARVEAAAAEVSAEEAPKEPEVIGGKGKEED
jgi:large subunit ribosomal protein L25